MSKLPIADFVNRDSNADAVQQPAKNSDVPRPRALLWPIVVFTALILIYPTISKHTEALFSDHSRLGSLEEFVLLCPKAALFLGGMWLAIEILMLAFQRKM